MTGVPNESKGVALTNWLVHKAAGMLEREPVGAAAAAVVAREIETGMAELLHQLDHGPGHGALVVRRVIGVSFRNLRPAVAGQIGDHQRER